jgi:uncharacterized membrane protein YphA (DoxX/SURF4 family)
MNRQAAGWVILRVCIGIFFVFEGLGKLQWFTHPAMLTNQLTGWSQSGPGSVASWYLDRIALPYATTFARLVPLGELSSGVALLTGFRTPLFAFIAFFMALNFQIASGAVFKYSFLTSGYGLPVLGSTLALALGGTQLPWSIGGRRAPRATRAPRS